MAASRSISSARGSAAHSPLGAQTCQQGDGERLLRCAAGGHPAPHSARGLARGRAACPTKAQATPRCRSTVPRDGATPPPAERGHGGRCADEGARAMDARAMCAIGKRGQLGWPPAALGGETGPEFAPVAHTRPCPPGRPGHVRSSPPSPRLSVTSSSCTRTYTRAAVRLHPGRIVFIGGGPPVLAALCPSDPSPDITRLPYDGPADRWFDPAAGRRGLTAGL